MRPDTVWYIYIPDTVLCIYIPLGNYTPGRGKIVPRNYTPGRGKIVPRNVM